MEYKYTPPTLLCVIHIIVVVLVGNVIVVIVKKSQSVHRLSPSSPCKPQINRYFRRIPSQSIDKRVTGVFKMKRIIEQYALHPHNFCPCNKSNILPASDVQISRIKKYYIHI
uniref:Uncharacterized protein n=1 Tax=Glossina austeni TaxID=7395 RepID=A0A1A9V4L5_GLOAU